jgi:hypothetical protein
MNKIVTNTRGEREAVPLHVNKFGNPWPLLLNQPDDPLVYRSPLEEGKYEKQLEPEGELLIRDFIKKGEYG